MKPLLPTHELPSALMSAPLKRRVTSDGTPYVDGYESAPSPLLIPPKRAKNTELDEILATGTPAVATAGMPAVATEQHVAKAEAALPKSPEWHTLKRPDPEEGAFVRNLNQRI